MSGEAHGAGYFRFPTIHDETVVFVCEDDLWTVPAGGGVARRLTSNLGEATRPALSPDGSLLAFVGREDGQPEIYLMPAQGGAARRLTYQGASLCVTAGWTGEGKILYASNAGHWYLRYSHLYQLAPQGGEPQRLNLGQARAIAYGPAGGIVVGRFTDDPARWKRYRGGTVGQLWVDETGEGEFRLLLRQAWNLASPMWLAEPGLPQGRIYFISDHEGTGNLYSCLPSGEDIQRHTDHADFYVRNASTDGQRIVYHCGADLFLYTPGSGMSQRIDVDFYSPQTQRSRKFVSAARYLQDWDLHPRGHSVALTARGALATFSNWEGAVLQHGESLEAPGVDQQQTAVRCRLPRWLKDGKRVVAVTDAGGEEAFAIFSADGSAEPRVLSGLDIGRPAAVAVSPTRDQIIFSNHRYELMCLDLESQELRMIDRGVASGIQGFNWSPDGEWVAYSISISMQLVGLKLWKAASNEVFPLTRPVLRDVSPSFDPRGRFIYFLSYRTFDPVYDQLHFDLGFPLGMKPYLITLQKDLPSPFIPRPKEEEPKEEEKCEEKPEGEGEDGESEENQTEDESEPDKAVQKPEEGEKKEAVKPLQIDLEGIEQRVVAFPVSEGILGSILGTHDGKVLYSRFPLEGSLDHLSLEEDKSAKGMLQVYNFDDQKEETLVYGVSDFDLSADNRWVIYRGEGRLRVLKAGEKPGLQSEGSTRKSGWMDLNRVRVAVRPGAEWRQMFREAWRLQRDQFWTPDMSQIDWVGIHDHYLSLVDRISTRSEFSDLMWEMQGELGTSHAYEFGGDYRPEPFYLVGSLGADFTYDQETGGWRITHIYTGDAWETKQDSPLNAPGVNARIGDVLFAINGKVLSQDFSPGMALVNLAGQEVVLTLSNSERKCGDESQQAQAENGLNHRKLQRTVTVKTLYNDTAARYREWVEANRSYVHQQTAGRVGYVHIPDMMGPGYAEFHRGFLAELHRQGLIVDVRFNRGGHVSPLILEKLARRRIGYETARWAQVPVPYPPDSIVGPMAAVTNENAGSDGDIFSHGFKMLGLGPLIGKRTWGGVIGINPRHTLVEGTITTQPEFSFWFDDVGWGVENYGTDPDIEVELRPQDEAQALDPQLERAVHEVLRRIEETPPQLPDFSQKPGKAAPQLPPR